jgi:serine/threonine protein kinase
MSKSKLNTQFLVDLLKTEVSIMQEINDEHVIHLNDFMESGSNYYLAMQLCNNGDVRQYIDKCGKSHLHEEEATFILRQIALGFKALHKINVMHRDFKTDNLFMNDNNVVIADLGNCYFLTY